MTEKEIAKIKSVVESYYKLKKEIRSKIEVYKQEVKERKRSPWTVQAYIDELYNDLWDTDTRKEFAEMSIRANTDPEFEKIFGPIFNSIFVP